MGDHVARMEDVIYRILIVKRKWKRLLERSRRE